MTTHDPNSADLHTDVTWMDRRDHLPAILSINARNGRDVWSADDFHRHLDGRNVIGKIAAHDGVLLGYMIYALHIDHIDVLKIEADPDHRGRGILEQMIGHLARQLSPDRRREVVFHISEEDADTRDILERCGATKTRIEPGYFKDGGQACEMRYHVRERRLLVPSPESPCPSGEPARPGATALRSARALPDGLRDARRALTEITGVEWDVVKPHRRAVRFVTVGTASDLEGVDRSDLGLRTVSKIADPAAACAAIRAFLGLPAGRTQAAGVGKAARVVIPVSWLRPGRRAADPGPPCPLRDAFTPADPQSRSEPDARPRSRRRTSGVTGGEPRGR